MSQVWTVGEALVDLVAENPGRLRHARAFRPAPGGAPANVAAGVARLGGRAGFIGKVGDDEFGHLLRDTLVAAGVDVSRLRMTTAARTGLAFVSIQEDGERDFLFYRSPAADMLLAAEDVDLEGFGPGDILYHGTVSLAAEPARSTVLALAEAAARRGALAACDPNLRLSLWPEPAEAIRMAREAVRRAHLVKVSQEELALLYGTTDPVAGARLLVENGAELAVVTLGAAGAAYAAASGAAGEVSGFAVRAVDTTGAGDGFMAGILVQLQPVLAAGGRLAGLGEAELREMIRFANGVGALVVTAPGAIPALPDRAAVEALIHGT